MLRDERIDVIVFNFCALLFLSMKNTMNSYEDDENFPEFVCLIHYSAFPEFCMCLWEARFLIGACTFHACIWLAEAILIETVRLAPGARFWMFTSLRILAPASFQIAFHFFHFPSMSFILCFYMFFLFFLSLHKFINKW